ncbi:hypothetical protein [Burkholderia diffusa]|uniref:hypothetical protein n=1 Tax=Burkholderia diffusa TaxID=488732 RepID=UPI0012D98FAC|nr:hypothetical protein [Burkholderia diffusa]
MKNHSGDEAVHPSSVFPGTTKKCAGLGGVDWKQCDLNVPTELVSTVCDKVRQVLRNQLGEQLADACYRIYEHGLAEGTFGAHSAIVRGLEVRDSHLLDEILIGSARSKFMTMAHELGLKHGALIRAVVSEFK